MFFYLGPIVLTPPSWRLFLKITYFNQRDLIFGLDVSKALYKLQKKSEDYAAMLTYRSATFLSLLAERFDHSVFSD